METIKVIRPGAICTDTATEITGTITHWLINVDKYIIYLFQPKGVNPEDGQPVEKNFVGIARLKYKKTDLVDIEVPVEILGSQVTDTASGFTGMAIELIQHINGCFHVSIQPKGVLEKNKQTIQRCDFDLRGCEGLKIPKLSPVKKERSKKEKPSPTGDKFIERRSFSRIPGRH